jgi:hypothetical protein
MAKRKKQEIQERGASADMAGDTTASNPERERIAARAYELYLARGRTDGLADEDWYAAERELSGDRARSRRQA